MTPGFQWYVAWRYLMARPRKPSLAVGITIGAFMAVSIGTALVSRHFASTEALEGISHVGGYSYGFGLASNIALALAELTLLLGALRYVFTFFTTVSMGGVAIGTMALVIALSVMNGFESDLRSKILGSNAHILISGKSGTFTGYRDLEAKIDKLPGVVGHTPYLVSEVVIAANSNYSSVIIKGIDPRTVAGVTDLRKNLEQPEGLERLWPVSPNGAPLGPPPETDGGDDGSGDGSGSGARPDAGPDVVDPAPGDLDVGGGEPLDLGGPDAGPDAGPGFVPPPGPPREPILDPAPLDLDDEIGLPDEEPIDLSGSGGTEEVVGRAVDIDVHTIPMPSELDTHLRAPRPSSPRVAALDGVLAGRELVKNLRLYVGQEVSIVSPLGQDTPAGPAPRTKPYRMAGTFFTGMYEYDTKFIYVDLHSLQRFLSLRDEVDGIEVRITDPDNTGPVMRAIAAKIGPDYRVQDWQEINRNLFSALKLEKIVMFLVLAIIILVASFSIVCNLIMVVIEKAKEIAILKTQGASDSGVMFVFVVQGLFIGVIGTGVGIANGLLACWLGKTRGLPLDPDVYYIDKLPIAVDPMAIAAVAAAGVLISVIATIYPAYMGARLRPVDGLRYE